MNQLPDLFVGQAGKGEHGSIGRSVADDPEQLTVRQGSHGFRAGEVSRGRCAFKIGFAFAIALHPMTGFTCDGFTLKLKYCFSGIEICVIQRNGILFG